MEKTGLVKYCKACGKKNSLQATFCMMCGKKEFFKPWSDFEIEGNTLVRYKGKGDTAVIPDYVTRIADGAVFGCRDLTSVVLPNSVTSIGKEAFAYCIELTSIVIPSSVTHVCADAFCECVRLTRIDFQGTKEEWGKIEIEIEDGDDGLWDKIMEECTVSFID